MEMSAGYYCKDCGNLLDENNICWHCEARDAGEGERMNKGAQRMGMDVSHLETSDKKWRACLICKGEIIQVRKALFTCLGCNQEYVSTEEDMEEK